MVEQRLFVAQAVQVAESQWFALGVSYAHPSDDGDIRPIRIERHHTIEIFLFPAEDEEDAFQKAIEWAENQSDINYDPPGDRNVFYTLGLHELEEYRGRKNIDSLRNSAYEVITHVSPKDIDAEGIPLVRKKHELELFRLNNTKDPPANA